MHDEILLLAAKLAAKAADRDSIEPGEYPVDAVVRVRGTLTVGEDYTARVVQSAEPWKLLAVALNKLNGITVESIVREADNLPADVEKDLKQRVSDALETIKGRTEKTCRGKTTVTGEVEVLTETQTRGAA